MGRSNWRAIVAVIATAALGVTAACSGAPVNPASGTGAQTAESAGAMPEPTEAEPTTAEPAVAETVPGAALQQADLERLGITVVADDRAAVAADSFTFSAIQIERLLTEQSLGGGVLGSDLDVIAPMPDAMPPTSVLLQAWLIKGDSAAADAGRAAMGEAAGRTTGIGTIRYPTVVVALFVADIAAMVTGAVAQTTSVEAADDATTATGPAGLRRSAVSLGGDAPCSAANNFIASTIKGVFDLLRLDLPASGGIFGAIIGTLASIWNYAVELARGVVTAVVGAITEAIFAKIRLVAAGLGAASLLISYLKGQQLVVTVSPQFTRVASGSEPDIPGRYDARAHPLSELWPPALMDCVKAAGSAMPELMLPGASATLHIYDPPARSDLVIPMDLVTTVAADHHAYLDFVTGREPAEWASGPERADGPAVTVEVEQKRITDFLRQARDSLLGDLKGAIVNLIPIAQVRSALLTVIGTVLDPIAARIEAELAARAGGVFTLRGHADPIMVTYHDQPEDPPVRSEDKHDVFCDKIREMVTWANANWEAMELEPFSAEILGRLVDARTVAPPKMRGPVDAGIPLYQATASGSDLALAAVGFEGLSAWSDGSTAIMKYCQINPGDWLQAPTG